MADLNTFPTLVALFFEQEQSHDTGCSQCLK